jgi:hypothetical protein
MTRRWLGILLLLLVLSVGAALAAEPIGPSAAPVSLPAGGGPEPPRREAVAPDISFIDSPDPTCYRPADGTGTCYVQWSYLYVEAAASQYMISMTVAIDGQFRAYQGGFFQNAMYVPGEIYGPGFEVKCGLPGTGGRPDLGSTHSYAIRARETGGLQSANYGSVTCPADIVHIFVPLAPKN